MPNPSLLSFLGVALEATRGTKAAPTAYIPVKTFTPKDGLTLIPDEGWRGSAVKTYGHVPGPIFATYDFGGDVYTDTIGFPIAGVLGDVVVTGAAAPYAHGMAVLNSGNTQPPSYTLTDYDAVNTLAFPGMQFGEVQLKFSGDKAFEYTAKATGYASVVGTKPTPSYSQVPIMAGWQGLVQIGGSAAAYVVDGELTIKRNVEAIHAVDGTQAPYAIWSDAVEVDGKLTCVMETDALRAQYVAGTSTSIDINYAQGTGATATGLRAHCSKAVLTSADVSRGKAYVELSVVFTADGNITDPLTGGSGGYSPVQVTVTNANPSGTYK